MRVFGALLLEEAERRHWIGALHNGSGLLIRVGISLPGQCCWQSAGQSKAVSVWLPRLWAAEGKMSGVWTCDARHAEGVPGGLSVRLRVVRRVFMLTTQRT